MEPIEVVHETSFSFVPSWSVMYLNWGVAVQWDRCVDLVDHYVVYRFASARSGRYINADGVEQHGKTLFTWGGAREIAARAALDVALGKMYLYEIDKEGWRQEEIDAIETVKRMVEEEKNAS